VTLTVRNGDDLAERFRHLHSEPARTVDARKHRGRGSVLDGVVGAVWSYEVKRGQNSGDWHPHLHMIALAEVEPSQERLSRSGTTSRG
jgi:plasmid rolling circle replication initiator protein Rep